MKIIIKNKEGENLLNCEFCNISIDGKTYSITLDTKLALDINLENDTLYYITFIDADELNLSGSYPMIYLSYHFSASTAFTTNEEGNSVSVVVVNSNTISFKRY
ncbi:MAG: hypothetical protein PQJ49_07735 [Sphaerochaetaceae bacterium]|nr:hypothetical protein [Sphaerochaetaceae bacterium]